jgi:hypothetical protein
MGVAVNFGEFGEEVTIGLGGTALRVGDDNDGAAWCVRDGTTWVVKPTMVGK